MRMHPNPTYMYTTQSLTYTGISPFIAAKVLRTELAEVRAVQAGTQERLAALQAEYASLLKFLKF